MAVWKRKKFFVFIATSAFLIYMSNFTGEKSNLHKLVLGGLVQKLKGRNLTFTTDLFSLALRSGYKEKSASVPRNVTIENGKIFTFNSFIEMEKQNEVPVITDKDSCQYEKKSLHLQPVSDGNQKFHLVTNFLYYRHKNYRSNLYYIYGKLTDDVVNARVMEVLDCLQDNLLHPFIKKVHVLVHELEAVNFLKKIYLKNGEKMVIKLTDEPVTMKSQIIYASNCLRFEVVAISHQDNKFGKGWERLKPEILLNKKIVYALTRHTALNISCSGSTEFANCDPGYPYIGSHDTFVFGVNGGLTSSELHPIASITPNLYGMENVMIWFFKKLGYRVMNPCPILHVHHHHCVAIREKGRKRVNTDSTSGGAVFTDRLE